MELNARIYSRTSDNGTLYARIIVPKELRPFLLKPALWRSLATADEKEARAARNPGGGWNTAGPSGSCRRLC